ncbi:MAG TPA: PVC-type heme-binding CxxCH protein [Gemmataceae bacterium]|nr:PVC-type heme-binding CxxCH protein [Gemmataceae bacterium]
MKTRPFFLLAACLAATPAAVAQVPPDKALATFKVSDGLAISLWASEPLLVNPTCCDIDHKGRVWVCESVNYRSTLRRQPLRRKEGDRILILEDTKGVGKADKVTVFYQAPEILAPLGIAVAKDPTGPGYKVFVCQSPDILVFEDKDGDGKADGPPKKLLTGFRGVDHDHGVHGILIGPDMKLYFSVGDQGVQDLQSSDGKGRKWTSNATDCRAGTIWRCDLDGKNLELIAHNFRNEYEPCVDSFGTVFTSDNDDDGNQQTRICYVMPGGNYGYHATGRKVSHWNEELPGVVPKILRTYFGSPTGMCVYEGTLLPKKYQGQLLHTDAGPRHVRCYHLTPKGAGYDVDREDMVTSTDNWFRPSDVCVAPDGSVFVADWYDPGVGGHGMGDTTRGRIYRIAPKGNKPSVPKVDLTTKKGILAALGSPNRAVRYMAMAKLQTLDEDKAFDVLAAAAQGGSPIWLRARALWQMALLHKRGTMYHGPGLVILGVENDADLDPRLRLLILRINRDIAKESPAALGEGKFKRLIVDSRSPAVRREALLHLRDEQPAKAAPLIYQLAKQYDGKDRFYLEAIGIAVGHLDEGRRKIILADFENHFPEWNEKVADLVWELRPPAVLPKLGKRLADKGLPAAQRARIVDILATSDDPSAGKAMLDVLRADVPPEVRARVIDNLRLFLPGKWRSLRQGKELGDTIHSLLARPETRAAGLELVAAAEDIPSAKQVADLAADGKQPVEVRKAAARTLGALPSERAVDALAHLLKEGPADVRPEVFNALGRLAKQRKGQPGKTPALDVLQTLVVSKYGDRTSHVLALEALVGSREGTVWLLDLHARGKLPEALKPDAARLLRNTPYQDLRNKALVAFPPPGRIDPKKLPPIPVLAARRGNAGRGKQLLAASAKNDLQCLKCHSVRGVGGSIGPDLSMIGKKASRENLYESILYPSKAIADQFVTWRVATTKGESLSGLLVEETPESLTLRDANGKDTRIDKKDIEAKEKSLVSLMPDNLVVYLTEDDLVDLAEYLLTLQTPTLSMDWWHVAGPFDNGANDAGLDIAYPPEKGIDLKATYRGKSGPVKWRVVRPDGQGYVDLRAFLGGDADNAVSYLYREVESPADQEATVLLGTDDGAKLWVNGSLVYTSRQHRAATPEQDRVKVKLKKGRNVLLLKINNGDGPHGFYFTVVSEQELKRVEGK